ncbi:hypothetical protein H8959_001367 [Pygathrix nigripes]
MNGWFEPHLDSTTPRPLGSGGWISSGAEAPGTVMGVQCSLECAYGGAPSGPGVGSGFCDDWARVEGQQQEWTAEGSAGGAWPLRDAGHAGQPLLESPGPAARGPGQDAGHEDLVISAPEPQQGPNFSVSFPSPSPCRHQPRPHPSPENQGQQGRDGLQSSASTDNACRLPFWEGILHPAGPAATAAALRTDGLQLMSLLAPLALESLPRIKAVRSPPGQLVTREPPPHKPCFIHEVATRPTPPSQEDELFPAEPQCADSDPV